MLKVVKTKVVGGVQCQLFHPLPPRPTPPSPPLLYCPNTVHLFSATHPKGVLLTKKNEYKRINSNKKVTSIAKCGERGGVIALVSEVTSGHSLSICLSFVYTRATLRPPFYYYYYYFLT